MFDKCTNSYAQRQSVGYNKAEIEFEKLLEAKKIKYFRDGFDEKNNFIPNFWNIHPMLRSKPDYIVWLNSKHYFFHVKGTNKIKLHDIMLYFSFQSLFCTKITPLYLAILYKEHQYIVDFNNFIKILEGLTLKSFSNDGKLYFEIPFDKLKLISEDNLFN